MRPRETSPMRNVRLFGTENPVVMITGSSAPRVGRTIAETFLEQGFQVVFHAHSRTAEAEELVSQAKQLGHSAGLVTGAVEDERVVQRWREELGQQFGRIDVLVNSAAIWEPKPLESTTAGDFEAFFRVNAMGIALTCKHFGLWMTEQDAGGAIINIGDWAVERPYRDFSAYFSSKGAVETMTRSMAVELATRNPAVRVNAVLPGPVMLAGGLSDERRRRIAEESLLKREGTAEDVAGAAWFLATSPFVTGVCLPVDGGRTIYAGRSADSIAHPRVND